MKMLRKILIAKVWKFLMKTSMKEFLSAKLQIFAIKIAHHRYFLEYVPKTSCLKKQYFEKQDYGGPAS